MLSDLNLAAESLPALRDIRARLALLNDWSAPAVHGALEAAAAALGLKLGKVAQPVRVAVSGSGVSPPMDVTLEVLGRELSLARLDRAIDWIAAHSR